MLVIALLSVISYACATVEPYGLSSAYVDWSAFGVRPSSEIRGMAYDSTTRAFIFPTLNLNATSLDGSLLAYKFSGTPISTVYLSSSSEYGPAIYYCEYNSTAPKKINMVTNMEYPLPDAGKTCLGLWLSESFTLYMLLDDGSIVSYSERDSKYNKSPAVASNSILSVHGLATSVFVYENNKVILGSIDSNHLGLYTVASGLAETQWYHNSHMRPSGAARVDTYGGQLLCMNTMDKADYAIYCLTLKRAKDPVPQ